LVRVHQRFGRKAADASTIVGGGDDAGAVRAVKDDVLAPTLVILGGNIVATDEFVLEVLVGGCAARVDDGDLDPATAHLWRHLIETHGLLAPAQYLLAGEILEGGIERSERDDVVLAGVNEWPRDPETPVAPLWLDVQPG